MSDEVIALNFGGEHMSCVDVTYKAPGKWKTLISAAPRAEDLDYSNAAVWDCLTVDRLVLAAFIAALSQIHPTESFLTPLSNC